MCIMRDYKYQVMTKAVFQYENRKEIFKFDISKQN